MMIKETFAKLFRECLKKGAAPFFMLIAAIAGYLVYAIKFRQFAEDAYAVYVNKGSIVVIILLFGFFIQKLSSAFFAWYADNIARKTKSKLDDKFVPIFRKIANMLIWLIVLVVLLSFLGVNISALIATLGVGSLAIALAAQDTIANIIAGFLIMIDRPFNIGDTIKLPSGEKVKVLDIGIRRSKFLAEDKAIIIVPNLDLSKSKIINYTYGGVG